MPAKIIIVRHGETDHNVNRILQGWLNVPLNAAGHLQAQRVAKRLSNEAPFAIYSSDQIRAIETATYISKHFKLPIIKAPALREDHLGVFQGWQWEVEKDEQREKWWEIRHQKRAAKDLLHRAHGYESLYHHLARVKNFFYELEQNHPDHTVIIVSHGGTINRIMEIFNFIDPAVGYMSYKNTSVSILEKSGEGYKLALDNDISHL